MADPELRPPATASLDVAAIRRIMEDPRSYPDPAYDVEIRETHLSVVALAGRSVWKVKKAVDVGFCDHRELEQRRLACQEEVRLNRRLAPDVYRGMAPLVRTADGSYRFDGQGEIVEWCVHMRRLDDADRLSERLGDVSRTTMDRLGRHIAAFHAGADRSPHIARFGEWEAVASLMRENFDQTRGHVGPIVHGQVWSRVRKRTDALLSVLEPLIDRRATRGLPCETHGDLRLEHVYLTPPGSFTVLDSLEFDERYRHADPCSDVAFLAMELGLEGRNDLARAFIEAWLEETRDSDARELLALYVAYRAVVRAKVSGIGALDPGRDEATRAMLAQSARRHWLYALGQLADSIRRPALLLVGGLPGVGKSTVAAEVAEAAEFAVLRSDVVRKELAGSRPEVSAAAPFEQGLYTPEWTERTYQALRDEVVVRLRRGERVIVDASFVDNARRAAFLAVAHEHGVPAWFVHVTTAPEVVEQRLARRRGDASDADVGVYRKARDHWAPDSDAVAARAIRVDGASPGHGARDAVIALLTRHGLGERRGIRSAGPPW
jgi:aminoglycoside phosphotransferase family enzyme/predicted kinase